MGRESISLQGDFDELLEKRFPPLAREGFVQDAIELLLSEKEASLLDWLRLYRRSESFRKVFDEAEGLSLAVFMIGMARQIKDENPEAPSFLFKSAVKGVAAVIRIKTFQRIESDFDFPGESDKGLEILCSPKIFDNKFEAAKALREICGIETPPKPNQRQENDRLEQFIFELTRHSKSGPEPRLVYAHGRTAEFLGVSPKALDRLFAVEPDQHYFNSGLFIAASSIGLLQRIMLPSPIRGFDNVVPLFGLGAAQKIVKSLQRTDRSSFYGKEGFLPLNIWQLYSFLDEKGFSAENVQFYLGEHLGFSPDLERLVEVLRQVDPWIDLNEEQIPFLEKDISSMEEVERKRADLLLRQEDLWEVKRRLKRKRLEKQTPVSAEDILGVMQEVFEERERNS